MSELLILKARPIVWRIIERDLPGLASHFSMDELVSEGMEALVRAMPRWDPTRGIEFGVYAWTAVRNALVDLATRTDRSTEQLDHTHEPHGDLVPFEQWVDDFQAEVRSELERCGHPEQSIDMLFAHTAGEPAARVGRRYGITRQAVQQRLQRIGPVDWLDLAQRFLAGRVPA